jgi:hypothetical protein
MSVPSTFPGWKIVMIAIPSMIDTKEQRGILSEPEFALPESSICEFEKGHTRNFIADFRSMLIGFLSNTGDFTDIVPGRPSCPLRGFQWCIGVLLSVVFALVIIMQQYHRLLCL